MKEQLKHPVRPYSNRRLSLEQLMGLTKPPAQEVLYTYQGEKGDIEVMTRGLTMVLSREVYANVRLAADIAVNVAKQNPDRQIWYVNTFAGIELMQQAMDFAKWNNAIPDVVPNPVLDTSEADAAGDDSESATPNEVLPNLHFFDIPLGEWDVNTLVSAMRGSDYLDPEQEKHYYAWELKQREERLAAKGVKPLRPIVIINSFDYSPLSRRGKWGMARELLQLLQAFDISLIVFTQEMRLEFKAGVAGRGSLGLLCGLAARVCRMKDPFEHLYRSRNPRNSPDNGTVHEAQMHAPKKDDRMSIVIKNTNGVVIEEVTGPKLSLARHVAEVMLT